tara:strand:- start:623 stop:784 length:162 start_codon:yes stop_codon:yes gene_type:complete
LPEAKLSAFTTVGKLVFFKNFFALSLFSKIPNLAVGILNLLHIFFVKIFEPSS